MKLAQALSMPLEGVRQERLWAGDAAAFEDLVAAHQKRIFALALRLLGDADEAWSATQDCFLRAFRAAARCPQDAAGQQQWLSRLAINLCLDRLRSRKWKWWRKRLGLEQAGEAGGEGREGCSLRTPERELLSKELGTHLARALDRLSPRQRAVFVLRHHENCPLEEIAEQLSMNIGTVKSHLWRAVHNLRRELKDSYGIQTSR